MSTRVLLEKIDEWTDMRYLIVRKAYDQFDKRLTEALSGQTRRGRYNCPCCVVTTIACQGGHKAEMIRPRHGPDSRRWRPGPRRVDARL